MKTWFSPVYVLVALALITSGVSYAESSGGGEEGPGGGGDGGAGGAGQVLRAPAVSAEQLDAFEKSLTAEQRKLLDEQAVLMLRLLEKEKGSDWLAKSKTELAKEGIQVTTKEGVARAYLREMLKWVVAATPGEQKEAWEHMSLEIRKQRKKLDPTDLDDEEKAAAAQLPLEAKAEVADLLNADVERFLVARTKVITRGKACVALVAEKLRELPKDSIYRVRLLSVLKELEVDAAAGKARLMRTAEAALKRLEELRAGQAEGQRANLAVLLSRSLASEGGHRETPIYDGLCYFSFPKNANGYEGAVSLMFDNGGESGDMLDVCMYGGQKNRIKDMGKVDFKSSITAPNAQVTATWASQLGRGVKAVAGNVYLVHCLEKRGNINKTYKFKVLEVNSSAWVIIEWQEVPQDK